MKQNPTKNRNENEKNLPKTHRLTAHFQTCETSLVLVGEGDKNVFSAPHTISQCCRRCVANKGIINGEFAFLHHMNDKFFEKLVKLRLVRTGTLENMKKIVI